MSKRIIRQKIEKVDTSLAELQDEFAVMELIAKGRSRKEISKELGISLPTVRKRIEQAFVKLTENSDRLREQIRHETYLQSAYLVDRGLRFLESPDLTPTLWKVVAETWLELAKYQATLYSSTEASSGSGVTIHNTVVTPTFNSDPNDPLYMMAREQIEKRYKEQYEVEVIEYMGGVEQVTGDATPLLDRINELE